MSPKLIEEIRTYKNNGLTDDEIKQRLSSKHPEDDIIAALNALQYMRPALNPDINSQNTTKNHSGIKEIGKKKWAIILLVILLVIIIPLYPFGLKQLTAQDVSNIDGVLINKYGVEKSYFAGSVTDCQKRPPTKFGDITGTHNCYLIVARVYYPRVKITKEQAYNKETKIFYDTDRERLEYVGVNGESIYEYIQLGIPVNQPGGGNPYRVDVNLGLSDPDHVVTSGISGYQSESGSNLINDKWLWSSEYSWLGSIGNGAKLMDLIDQKIINNQPPADGAPAATMALDNNTAPIVVYYRFRYCHSPSFIFLDNLCIIPK